MDYRNVPMASPMPQNSPIYNLFILLLRVGQLIGLFPLHFSRERGTPGVRFQWISYKTVYSGGVVILLIFVTVSCYITGWLVDDGWTFRHILRTVFYTSSMFTTIALLRSTRRIPMLMQKWMDLDYLLGAKYGYPPHAIRYTKCAIIVTFLCCLGQILLFSLYTLQHVKVKAVSRNITYHERLYFIAIFPQIFEHLPYNLLLGLLCQCCYMLSILGMAYLDLLISLIGLFFSFRYQQITKKLRAVVWKVNQPEPNPTFWKDIREDYNRICVLGCDIENIITNLIFVSYACNLLLSLVYLRYITVIPGFTTEKVYNIVCFAVYVTKMFLTSVYLSKVNVSSLEASIPLNSVSTRQYNVEIQRLLQQINGNCVAFTGNKVFRVTRHIVLHIFAIMLTYELVLVQFSQLNFHIH